MDRQALIFINSIASVCLRREDSEYMDQRWHELRRQMVIEITEEEEMNREALEIKRHAPGFSGMFALDDYGSGYSNEGSLLELAPRFIKVDISIIRGIDSDPDKQEIPYRTGISCSFYTARNAIWHPANLPLVFGRALRYTGVERKRHGRCFEKMVQVDLITGFLGAGKTTFLRRYVRYLVEQGHNVCILENDFGAVNVDAMLVQDLLGDRCDLETISGGCDCDTHQRRMRTKLIAMAMRGFDRVVVEPSGIFDVDEFFDVLRDDPLDRWYRIGNVIAIVDAMLPEALSPQAEYLLASETANAGRVLLSRAPQAGPEQCRAAIAHLDRALEACKCSRRFAPDEILTGDWAALTDADLAQIAACGMRQASCEKLHFDEHKAFGSLCFLEQHLTVEQLQQAAARLFGDPACGQVLRVKGFAPRRAAGWS